MPKTVIESSRPSLPALPGQPRTAAQIAAERRRDMWWMVGLVTLLCATGVVFPLSGALILIVLWSIALYFGPRYTQNSWLPETEWNALAALFEKHPELQSFQLQVVQQGRPFTQGEAQMLHQWGHRQQDYSQRLADWRRIYDLPATGTGVEHE